MRWRPRKNPLSAVASDEVVVASGKLASFLLLMVAMGLAGRMVRRILARMILMTGVDRLASSTALHG